MLLIFLIKYDWYYIIFWVVIFKLIFVIKNRLILIFCVIYLNVMYYNFKEGLVKVNVYYDWIIFFCKVRCIDFNVVLVMWF